jgi:hypothetical protein
MNRLSIACAAVALLPWTLAHGQERHGRGYKPPPATATVVVTVEKNFNSKPFPNASVIFHATREEQTDANLEMKTDPDGRATIDLLEVGSHVTVQVIANGYATYASDFDLTADGKQLMVKLQRPRAQVSEYGDPSDRPANVQPGVQERPPAKAAGTSTAAPPAAASPTGPLQTTPPANTPATAPGSAPAGATPGTPSGSPQ